MEYRNKKVLLRIFDLEITYEEMMKIGFITFLIGIIFGAFFYLMII